MFPRFSRSWIQRHHVWRARYAQPVVEPNYAQLIPEPETPFGNVLIASMAQIYPEDRGTNYAVREGRRVGRRLAQALRQRAAPSAAGDEAASAVDPAASRAVSGANGRRAGRPRQMRWEA
jgi:hypothetical protein